MEINNQSIIGKIVAENYKAASVFKKYKIDFCCNGNRTIADASRKKQMDEGTLISELKEATSEKNQGEIDFKSFPLDLLADYIEKTHHRYIDSKIPEITPYLEKIVSVHGDNHTELFEVERLFKESAGDLSAHLRKEELMLFPYIRQLVKAQISGGKKPVTKMGDAAEYIALMEDDHNVEGERFRTISELTDNYNPPADACNTYKVTFSLLQEFEENLHRHIHLENNILFPKSIALNEAITD
ncbi:MAG: iron-sulfur cluster repair di-iron protein [Fermentimonas sp.]|jgi:regulator of cell morphogenesis and NO signaling|nr:iron-sulfur cluster repair di-iron protein [Fermentimonas sp.]MDD4008769.1 iron-sulfur cluster repair di-iron protein [Fermentimonas sp.]MDD4696541.1 iron-sulfur cluster repair di-iron protein [Fermentimonas sp.]